MKKKLLLVDGHSIANRAFYGIPLLTNKEGRYTNAVYGFLTMVMSILEKEHPDYLGIAFDTSAPTFRHEYTKEYKGNRKGMPEELRPQIPLLKQVLSTMGIFTIQKEGFEADDVIGTLAKRAEQKEMEVVVFSGDRDLFQITTDNISLTIPRTKKTGTETEFFSAKEVQETYGVTPTEYIDVKALMGDPSDNIKGVPGVGEKTALKLIKEYHSIEDLFEKIEQMKPSKLKEKLIANEKEARESKYLATIICDVPLECKVEDFTYTLTINNDAYEMLKQLEFKNLLNRLPRENQEDRIASVEVTYWNETQFNEFIQKAKQQKTAFSYFVTEETIGIAGTDGKTIGYIECNKQDAKKISLVKEYMQNNSSKKITYDSKALRHQLVEWDITIENIYFDTLIATYLLYPTTSSYDIAQVAELFLGNTTLQTTEELLGKGKSKKSHMDLSLEERATALIQQANILFTSESVILEKLQDMQMLQLFEEIEMPLIEVLFSMEQNGIKVNIQQLQQYGTLLQSSIETLEEEIYGLAGESFNINSPKQLGIILFEKLSLPSGKKTKTGYSTAADVLFPLKKEYPIVAKILEYRQYVKLKSTYVEGLLNVLTEDKKIHSTFNQTITATGRLSSTEPNLQNIPVKLPLGKKIREMFIPSKEGYVFLDGDYSQIELRVLADMAQDTTLIHAFKEEIDIHALTASQVFHTPLEEVTGLQRSNAKAVNFGIVYGISAFALAEDLEIPQVEAQAYINAYFEKYPKVKAYLDQVVDFAMRNGYVETLYHRKREIPEILSSQYRIREFGKRIAMNTPIQGTAADIIKIAMINIYRKFKENKVKARLLLTVHDELLVEAPIDEVEKIKEWMKIEMENAAKLQVPLSVEVHVGENWLAVK